jgi:serine/threonine protein kinase
LEIRHRVEELLGKYININIPLENIEKTIRIGRDGFGTVDKAVQLSTTEIVAVKELLHEQNSNTIFASLYEEVETMASLDHPLVLKHVGAHIHEPLRIITRYCSAKSLFDLRHHPLKEFTPLGPTQLT